MYVDLNVFKIDLIISSSWGLHFKKKLNSIDQNSFQGKGGHKAIVEALIKKYADVDVKGKDGKSCLHWAIDKNHASIVKIILSANPDMVYNEFKWTQTLSGIEFFYFIFLTGK